MTKPGFVSVPVEPTDAMLDEGFEAINEGHKTGSYGECPGHTWGDARRCYAAMLAAAPSPEPRAVEDVIDTPPALAAALLDNPFDLCGVPAPQSAPAPLTPSERQALTRMTSTWPNEMDREVLERLCTIADYHRDREGKK